MGRFHLPHRHGTRVEVGEPICLGGDRPWMCAVKLVGTSAGPAVWSKLEPEPTQTLLVRTGRGATPDDARRDALAQLTLVYGSPVEPQPEPVILQKPSEPPPAAPVASAAFAAEPVGTVRAADSTDPRRSGWMARVGRAMARLLGA